MRKNRKKVLSMARAAEIALQTAVARVIEEHWLTGDPIAVWRNGRAQWVYPVKKPNGKFDFVKRKPKKAAKL